MMDTKRQKDPKKTIRTDSAPEVLRGLGGGVLNDFSKDFLGKIPQDVFNQAGLRPQNNPDSQNPAESLLLREQAETRNRVNRAEAIRYQEKLVFTAKDRETQAQVAALLEEARNLTQAVETLATEVEIAATQTVVEPGVYHTSFFGKLITFIKTIIKEVEGGAVWSKTANARAKKQSHYWASTKKSGSKFLLSQERYMATQAG